MNHYNQERATAQIVQRASRSTVLEVRAVATALFSNNTASFVRVLC